MRDAGIAIVSVLLGVVADRLLTVFLERSSEKEQLSRVRTLLGLEIDRNLSEVRKIRDELAQYKEGLEAQLTEVEMSLQLARKLARIPWPGWIRTAWEGRTALISAALTSSQIAHIHKLHTRLDALTSVRDMLARTDVEDRDRWSRLSAQYGGHVP